MFLYLRKAAHSPIRCRECHNSSIWNFDEGKEFTSLDELKILQLIQPEYIKRFSLLGGEPLVTQNLKTILPLLEKIKMVKPSTKIWIYTGYTYEQLQEQIKNNPKDYYIEPILRLTDILIDGPFIQEKKDITLAFRGSSNQRLIDMPQTLKQNKVITLDL